jgi:hypothetical protein
MISSNEFGACFEIISHKWNFVPTISPEIDGKCVIGYHGIGNVDNRVRIMNIDIEKFYKEE